MDRPERLPLPEELEVVEVGPRDGIQFLDRTLPTGTKIELIDALSSTGVPVIEAASFVHPKAVPQMADAEEVLEGINRPEGVRFRGLVPNLRGAQRAVETELDEIQSLIACDEKFNRKNQNMTIQETLEQIRSIHDLTRGSGHTLSVILALAFFTPGTGPTPPENVHEVVDALHGIGIRNVQLAMSVGMAEPNQVYERVRRIVSEHDSMKVGLHVHNRNGFALANVLAGLQAGVTSIESSVLGLGGDILFPGRLEVMGNVPTEDVIHFLDSLGVSTGVDLEQYLETVEEVEELLDVDSAGYVTRGGTRKALSRPEAVTDTSFSSEGQS